MGFNFGYPSIILSYLLFFFSSPSLFSHATDTLTHDQSISDEETLSSSGGIFELGFFSPGSSKYRYVGIWYRNISTRSVVWVANREAPLKNSSGNFTIGSDGNLLVLDGGGSIVWSSNLSVASNDSTAQLLDSGNLVLWSGNGKMLWQSFDHPTDTFLPGMKLSLDTKTGKRQIFTSWKSADDPSAGNYSLSIDPLGSPQVFMWEGTVPRWRSGEWNGQVFTGTTMRSLYIYGFKYVNDVNQGTMYFTFTQFNSSLLRFVLQWDGVENSTMLVGETQEWENVWAEPTNECEIYGKCGNYGMCNDGDTPICSCLEGFEPGSSEEWSKGNWSGGCVRRTPLDCQLNRTGDGFLRVAGVKLPDRSNWASTVLNEAACETACLKNCSCKAYSFDSGIGCMTWVHDLIDIYQYPEGDNDLYVKLAGSELGR